MHIYIFLDTFSFAHCCAAGQTAAESDISGFHLPLGTNRCYQLYLETSTNPGQAAIDLRKRQELSQGANLLFQFPGDLRAPAQTYDSLEAEEPFPGG